jgi:alpha-glucosidase
MATKSCSTTTTPTRSSWSATANPSLVTPPLILVCNLSAKPLRLSLKQQLTSLHLRGSFLRSLLHFESEDVPMNLDAVSLPAFGVYVGELRY